MGLHQRTRIARIGLQVEYAAGMRVQHGIGAHLFVRGQPDHRAIARRRTPVGTGRGRQGDGGPGRYGSHASGGNGRRAGRRAFLALATRCVLRCALGSGEIGILVRVGLGTRGVQVVDRGRVDFEPTFGGLAPYEGRAPDVADLLDGFARGQSVGDFDDGALGIAIHEQVALGIDQDGPTHLVLPVVVMGDAPQRRLDAAHDEGHVAKSLAAALRINQ
jgi:hypothetical protein